MKIVGAAVAAGLGTSAAEPAVAAVTRRGIGFDTVLDAVDDLGMDPTGSSPVNGAVKEAADRNALVEMPPGEYRVDPSVVVYSGNAGFVGQGDSRRDVRFTVPKGAHNYTFNLNGGSFLFENLSWDQGFNWDRYCANRIGNGGTLKAVKTELVGTEPHPPSIGDDGSNQANVFLAGGNTDLVLDDFVKKGPVDSRDYPDGRSVVLGGNGANVTVRNSDIRNTTVGQALYVNNTDGDVLVENNYFENTPHTAIRINGNGVARNNMVVIDPQGKYNHPDNRWNSKFGGMRPMRAIWVYDSMGWGSGEAVLENNHVYHRSGDLMGGVMVHSSVAGARMRNCRVKSDPGASLVSASSPATIEDSSFTGTGGMGGSGTVQDSTVAQDISLSLSTTNVERISGPEPEIVRGEPPGSEGSDSTSGDTSTADYRTLAVEGNDSYAEYAFTVSETLEENPNLGSLGPNDSIDGTSAQGAVYGGTDGYQFDGDLIGFDVDGDVTVRLNGSVVDPASLGLSNHIVLDGRDAEGETSYEIGVSGELVNDPLLGANEDATVDGSTATGTVADDRDGYRFTGDLTSLSLDGDADISFEDTDG